MNARFVPLALAVALPAGAQSFQNNTTDIPSGGAANGSVTENLSFADVDSDGDLDAVFADGGDLGNDQNRIWINQGGLQGGTVGVFADDTAARLPSVQDTSRDIDFADIDLDGDQDFFAANTSGIANQGGRFFVNQGGAQAGTEGFFAEATGTAFVNLGVNDGTSTFSSIDVATVIPGGSWVDWSCDAVFGDLDGDGDMDLVHTTYGNQAQGKSPARLFLNDGAGHFEEFNPSGFQLTGVELDDSDPALWADGVQMDETTDTSGLEADVATRTLAVNVGDLDGDLDVDILLGDKVSVPRIFTNRTEETGALIFRDRSHAVLPGPNWSPGKGSYEQDLADFDNDGDLDLYGPGWSALTPPPIDLEFRNLGTSFGAAFANTVPYTDQGEPDFIDYDNDGDLDLFLSAQVEDEQLVENTGPGGGYALTAVVGGLPPVAMTSQGADIADVDQDGDYDVFLANDLGEANVFYENVTGTADTTAPRVQHLEQAPNRDAGFAPTEVRCHVYDNTTWALTQFADVVTQYSVDGGAFTDVDMTFSGGQVFRGEIPGLFEGVIDYRVRATDLQGNAGVSPTLSYTAGPCTGDPVAYCTAGFSASGCQALVQASGTPSATLTSGFTLTTTSVEGGKNGFYLYGTNGRQANSWGSGTSFVCVVPPRKRGGLKLGTGTAGLCDGAFAQDLNARWCSTCPKPLHNPGAGALMQAQLWYRDPQSTSNQKSSLSDAIEFSICP
jgi:hypothetical protein